MLMVLCFHLIVLILGMEKTKSNEITRKSFLRNTLCAGLGLSFLPNLLQASPNQLAPSLAIQTQQGIRSISYNVFNGCAGYIGINGLQLPDGSTADLIRKARKLKQVPQRIVLELALYDANIISFSEGPSKAVLEDMAKMMGYNSVFFGGGKDGKGKFPGAVLTPFKVLSSMHRPFVNKSVNDPEELFTRHWGKATLQLPDGQTLVIHSAHLWPFKKSPKDTEIRLAEIAALHEAINEDLKDENQQVLLQGDLNLSPDMPEYKALTSGKLKDTFTLAGFGDGNTANSKKALRRIDYIFAGGALLQRLKSCTALNQGCFRLNNEDPMGFALSDHLPVLTVFE